MRLHFTRRGALLALAGIGVWASAQASGAASVPELDAVVRYETRQVLASGVTRTEQWQERFVRRGDQVWSERVLSPANAPRSHGNHEAHGAHKHFDFERAARLVTRDAAGAVRLRFADMHERVVVSVPPAEYGAVGFDGRWDTAAHLVPPSLVAAMELQRPSGPTPAKGQWRVQRDQGWTHRVLWSPALQVALRIESQRDDGSAHRTVVLQAQAGTRLRQPPWAGLERWTQREYDDYLD